MYLVINYRDSCGNAYKYIKEDVEKLGLNFRGLYGLKMPENYLMLFDLDSDDVNKKIILNANKPSNNPPKKTTLVKGGNTKAVNNLATQENKARGSVIENVDRNGKDITPSGDTEKDKENLVDVRQFLTFQTKSGKTMHLIVDHSSNQDNVRLLTEVGEQDLLNMIESEDKNTIKVEEPKKEEVKKEEPTVVPVKEEKKSGIGSFLIVALVIGGVVGAGYYFKVVKAKEDKMLEDFEEDDEDYISESEDESDNEESHEESLDEDDELL